jgi:hypothetical protein
LTLPAEYGTNATVVLPRERPDCGCAGPDTSGKKIPPGEDGMDFEKDNFDDETELSPLEDEEVGGDGDGLVETEEEELIISEEPEEEAVPKPAAKPASKPAAKKVPPKPKKAAVKKAPAKKAKKAGAKKPAKKAKKAKKAAKKKKR